jgi:hypothetical protein
MECGLPEDKISVNQNIRGDTVDLHVVYFACRATRGIVDGRRVSAPRPKDRLNPCERPSRFDSG